MATQTTKDFISYYVALLIMQASGKTRARNTIAALTALTIMPQKSVQQITFSAVPTAGAFTLSYAGNNTASLPYNATAGQVQTALQAVSGLSAVLVTGSMASKTFTVSFEGVTAPAEYLIFASNTLTASAAAVVPTVVDTDLILPLAVQDAFNLYGLNVSKGVQLDVIGKYAGVSRVGVGLSSNIVLGDSDYLSLIRFGVLTNSAGSDLYTIQTLLRTFFLNQVFIFDYQNMRISYLLDTTVGSPDFVKVLISQGLLPKPMTVQMSIIYVPDPDKLFTYRTYTAAAPAGRTGFNTYSSYSTESPWVSYKNNVSF